MAKARVFYAVIDEHGTALNYLRNPWRETKKELLGRCLCCGNAGTLFTTEEKAKKAIAATREYEKILFKNKMHPWQIDSWKVLTLLFRVG